MALRKKRIPRYGTVQVNGHKYYRTDVEDAEGKRVILYGKTREELYDKEMAALEKVDNITFRQKSPTVAEYCEKWLLMQSVHIRNTTLTDYTSKVRRHIIKELGQKRMAEVTLDDIQVALVPVSKKPYLCISRLSSCISPFFAQHRKVMSLIRTQQYISMPKAAGFLKRTNRR